MASRFRHFPASIPLRRCFFLLLFFPLIVEAQEPPPWIFHAGIVWNMPTREFGEFWDNGPGVTFIALSPLADPVHLTLEAALSSHSPADTPKRAKIPHVLLLSAGVGFELIHDFTSFARLSAGLGGFNYTFVFASPVARPGFDNIVESEVGVRVSGSLTFPAPLTGPVRVAASYQTILTGPDPVGMITVGVSIPIP